ncbi:MAG: glycosyltransferase family 39 protein [Candidatus Sumerlaeota bacterium]|nr:glycosyltransferase family 39 protein [Candidatus Sumerlaeota bacterium]
MSPDLPAEAPRRRLFLTPAGMMALVLAGAFILRARMLEVPLERDEGVYAYLGRLILQGVPMYSDAADLQMPLLWLSYAGFMALFGKSVVGIHLGLLVVNLATVWLMFLLGRRLCDPAAGVVAAAGYAILSLDQKMLGFTANAEHFILLPALAGLWLLLRAEESRRPRGFFASGLLLGVGMVVKQQGLFFVAFGGAYVLWLAWGDRPLWRRRHLERLAAFGLGAALPFLAFCLWFAYTGVLGRFFFWIFEYSSKYASKQGIARAPVNMAQTGGPILHDGAIFFGLAGLGLLSIWMDSRTRRHAPFLTALPLFSFLAVSAGFFYRHHYYILLLPAVSLLGAAAIRSLSKLFLQAYGKKAERVITVGLTLLAVAQTASVQRDALFRFTPDQINKSIYKVNPFVESPEIGRYIREHSNPSDQVAILGSEPQILLYADRDSATKQIVMYPMVWGPPDLSAAMQKETAREIEEAKPRFLVFVNVPTSWWGGRVMPDLWLIRWLTQEARQNYFPVGIVSLAYPGASLFVWGQEALHSQARSPYSVLVLERRPSPAAASPGASSAPAASAPDSR